MDKTNSATAVLGRIRFSTYHPTRLYVKYARGKEAKQPTEAITRQEPQKNNIPDELRHARSLHDGVSGNSTKMDGVSSISSDGKPTVLANADVSP